MKLKDLIKKKYDKYEQKQTLKKAAQLKDLKKERVKYEGRAKIEAKYNEEKDKLKKAKWNTGFRAKIKKEAGNISQKIKEREKNRVKGNVPTFGDVDIKRGKDKKKENRFAPEYRNPFM